MNSINNQMLVIAIAFSPMVSQANTTASEQEISLVKPLVIISCSTLYPAKTSTTVLKDDGKFYHNGTSVDSISDDSLAQVVATIDDLRNAPLDNLRLTNDTSSVIKTVDVCDRGVLDISIQDPRVRERRVIHNSMGDSILGLSGADEANRAKAILILVKNANLALGKVPESPLLKTSIIARNADGSLRRMVESAEYMKSIGKPLPDGEMGAKEYCESLNAHLPSIEELHKVTNGRDMGTWFWSSTPHLWSDGSIYSNDDRAVLGWMHDSEGYSYRYAASAVLCLPNTK